MIEDLIYCPVCGVRKRIDLSKAGVSDVRHCGRVMRLFEEPAAGEGQVTGDER